MARRIQVMLSASEYRRTQHLAQVQGISVSEWIRQTVGMALGTQTQRSPAEKLKAIRAAVRHAFPTGDIEDMLR